MQRFIRFPEAVKALGVSRSEIYRRIKSEPHFPKPVKILGGGTKAVGFVESELVEYQAARIAERDAHIA
jgi:prophage regulatory protein